MCRERAPRRQTETQLACVTGGGPTCHREESNCPSAASGRVRGKRAAKKKKPLTLPCALWGPHR